MTVERVLPPADDGRPVLVTGGAGFIGSNLADRLAGLGREVIVFDALSRPGVSGNLEWLRARHGSLIQPVIADLRDRDRLDEAIDRAGAVFHMAAQVAVTTSLQDPEGDFDVNLRGTLHVLEGARRQDRPPAVIFASTNKVYGNLGDIALARDGDAYLPEDPALRASGIGEDRPLSFYTPYGCSKGAADQYVLDYARGYGVPACVLRMSCIYGPRQLGTEDQGWLAHFLYSVRPASRSASTATGGRCATCSTSTMRSMPMWAPGRESTRYPARRSNLGGGPANAVTLLDVLHRIGELTGRTPDLRFAEWIIPLIDVDLYTDDTGDIHDRFRAFSLRDRLRLPNGDPAPNHVIWTRRLGDPGAPPTAEVPVGADVMTQAVVALDRWVTALAAEDPTGNRAAAVARTRPDDVADECLDPTGRTLRGPDVDGPDGACTAEFPIHGDPRTSAGARRADNILKCTLVPVDPAAYIHPLTVEQQARLEEVFPAGVCDWTARGVGELAVFGTWQSYASGLPFDPERLLELERQSEITGRPPDDGG